MNTKEAKEALSIIDDATYRIRRMMRSVEVGKPLNDAYVMQRRRRVMAEYFLETYCGYGIGGYI